MDTLENHSCSKTEWNSGNCKLALLQNKRKTTTHTHTPTHSILFIHFPWCLDGLRFSSLFHVFCFFWRMAKKNISVFAKWPAFRRVICCMKPLLFLLALHQRGSHAYIFSQGHLKHPSKPGNRNTTTVTTPLPWAKLSHHLSPFCNKYDFDLS